MPRPIKTLDVEVLKMLYFDTKREHEGSNREFKKVLLDKLQDQMGCSRPTAYKILRQYEEELPFRENKVAKTLETMQVYVAESITEDWILKREKILDKIIEFIKTMPFSPKVESLLMKINWVREELKSGLDDGIDQIRSRLELDFGVDLDTLVAESKGVGKVETKEPEDSGEVPASNEEAEEGEEIEREDEQGKTD